MSRLNKTPNDKLKDISVAPIAAGDARRIVIASHYMKTFPQGAKLCFAVINSNIVVGVAVFGYSSSTQAKAEALVSDIKKREYIEMQRLWINDNMGHSTESYTLARLVDIFKKQTELKLIVTHAGGCKDDCGIVYQASAWLYFGSDKCSDFYLTKAGEYKNMIAALRFGRVSAKGKTKQQVGEELFGAGEVVDAHRHLYAYPIHKGIRRRLNKIALPYPKRSKNFRYNQNWVEDAGDGNRVAGND